MPIYEVEAKFETCLNIKVKAGSEQEAKEAVDGLQTCGYVSSGHVTMAGIDWWDLLERVRSRGAEAKDADVSQDGELEVVFISEDEDYYDEDDDNDEEE